MGSSCGGLANGTNVKHIDFRSVHFGQMMSENEEGIRMNRRRCRSIDEQVSGCMVDLQNRLWAVLAVVKMVFSFLHWWTWGMSSRGYTTEEVDCSPIVLLEQTTSTPRCRSGECIRNQLVNLSLAVLYFEVFNPLHSFFVVSHS